MALLFSLVRSVTNTIFYIYDYKQHHPPKAPALQLLTISSIPIETLFPKK